jgi:mono/diheme cytochrome c family protein
MFGISLIMMKGETMRNFRILVWALGFALSLSLIFAAAGDAKKGKEIFTKSCMQCHAEKGEGKPAIEKMFSVKMKPLASTEVQAKTDDQIKKIIKEGSGKMKPVVLSEAEQADVVAFLRTLAQK